MCGIVGLFLKDRALEPDVGRLLAPMLVAMTERGPDSAGIAIYGEGEPGRVKLTLRAPEPAALADCEAWLAEALGCPVAMRPRDTHAV